MLVCVCVWGCFSSKSNEELKQQNSELSEKLRSQISENLAMKLDVEDLQKKLEMAELMIQQVMGTLLQSLPVAHHHFAVSVGLRDSYSHHSLLAN